MQYLELAWACCVAVQLAHMPCSCAVTGGIKTVTLCIRSLGQHMSFFLRHPGVPFNCLVIDPGITAIAYS
jgi:hypothetical protein